MEELEELIEDADRDGSGSVDFQVTMLFIVHCACPYVVYCGLVIYMFCFEHLFF